MESKTWTQLLTAKSRSLPHTLPDALLPKCTSLLCCAIWLSFLLLFLMLCLFFFLKLLWFCPQFSLLSSPPHLPSPCQQFHLILSCTITSAGLTAKCASSSLDLALLSFSPYFHLDFFIYIWRFCWHFKPNYSEQNIPLLNLVSFQFPLILRMSQSFCHLSYKLKGSLSTCPQLDKDLRNLTYSIFSTVASRSGFTHYI